MGEKKEEVMFANDMLIFLVKVWSTCPVKSFRVWPFQEF
jgi:hypothetical protein